MAVMTTVAESSGTVNFDEGLAQLTDTRAIWRDAVTAVAERATAALPDSAGRIAKAVTLVLAGDVDMLGDGTARVASQSNGETIYHIVNGHCDCKDYPKAPQGFCKHRLAHALAKRAYPLAKSRLDAVDHAPSNGHVLPPTVEAPLDPARVTVPVPETVSVTRTAPVPAEYVVEIQGKPFVKFAGLLKMAHEHGLVSLTATWSYNDGELSLAQAVATFADGRTFTECGDATPANTNRKVAVHFRRVALTRAKARALRDALGVDLVAVEELRESE
jgi:hypothetical protein